ncbi:TetR/AcrR family transcriptional regulator [Goodfellowiella coeruleoviolacea]|uniref:Transcriptional regulator, TetR family n=1 Tax=Goodfellowiella coeruleoviolacea TaxID=334858 RepID=A0AAE3KFV3_9PSEU|nr:TetR/AcrR family transcriptional regulator [Goodfellowiella coeruleoviolacea]MCP2164809.1 transcriptional regulator, TetR family [Goodfellowiella coeruleoviolacea]
MSTTSASRRTQRERTEATTAALLGAARELFATDGFALTSLNAICERAGVTRGAFYHHFSNKEQIFREVYAVEQHRLSQAVRESFRQHSDPWTGLIAGCRALLEKSLEPTVWRLTLVEAPAALGWTAMRDIQTDCKNQMRTGLAMAIEAGCIPSRPLEPLTSLLYGALTESALDVVHAEDTAAWLEQTLSELRLLLAGLVGRIEPGCAHTRTQP